MGEEREGDGTLQQAHVKAVIFVIRGEGFMAVSERVFTWKDARLVDA